jgi:hypothetical protein
MPELEIKVKKTYTLSDMSYMELCILASALDRVATKDILADLPTRLSVTTENVGEIANNLYKVMVDKV